MVETWYDEMIAWNDYKVKQKEKRKREIANKSEWTKDEMREYFEVDKEVMNKWWDMFRDMNELTITNGKEVITREFAKFYVEGLLDYKKETEK